MLRWLFKYLRKVPFPALDVGDVAVLPNSKFANPFSPKDRILDPIRWWLSLLLVANLIGSNVTMAQTADELIARADYFSSTGDYVKAEHALIQAMDVGSGRAASQLAFLAAIGETKTVTLDGMMANLATMRDKGDYVAAVGIGLLWLLKDNPKSGHRFSQTNHYLAIRDIYERFPSTDTRTIGLHFDPAEMEHAMAEGPLLFSFKKQVDAMTDKASCQLVSDEYDGVSLGLDMQGIYLESKEPLALDEYMEMGIRIDGGEYFRVGEPQILSEQRKDIRRIATLRVRGGMTPVESRDALEMLGMKYKALSFRVYIAPLGSPEFDRAVGAMAIGMRVLVRVRLAGGIETTTSIPLRYSYENVLNDANVFDLYAVPYLSCAYRATLPVIQATQ